MSETMEIRAIRGEFLFGNPGVSCRPQSERAFMGETYVGRSQNGHLWERYMTAAAGGMSV